MKSISVDILTSKEKNRIATDVGNLINDSQLCTPVILCKITDDTYNPDTGITTASIERDSVNAIRGEFSLKELSYWQGTIEIGDAVFLLKKSDYIDDLGADLDREDEILEARYDYGQVTVTNASADVTGSGTLWKKNAYKGDWFRLKYETTYYKISSVTNNTSLTLASNYTGVTKSNELYVIYQKWKVINVMKDIMNSIRKVHCRRVK